jgi:hypothetical protein
MKVYVVVAETDPQEELFYEIIGIFQNEDEAIEKVADIMQDIEAYVKTYPAHDENLTDEEDEKRWRTWNENYPHKIKDTDEKIDTVYVKEFDLL